MKVSARSFFVFQFFFLAFLFSNAQDSKTRLPKTGKYKKCWVLAHPFSAPKAIRISKEALRIANEKLNDPELDADINGGQVDAFKHAYWMALLAQKMRWKKALRLGIAHEKDDYILFLANAPDPVEALDSIASVMDLFNNSIGIEIGRKNKKLRKEELQLLIKTNILAGNFKIISKNKNKDWLDCSGKIIGMEKWKGKWGNTKCLVKSVIR